MLAALLVIGAPEAHAHSLAVSSDPPAGAILQQAPAQVTVTFSERPDAALSSVRVTDAQGHEYEVGHSAPAAGSPSTLTAALGPLPDGIYTVTWRTVSQVDGHIASGSYSFGVGVSPASSTSGEKIKAAPPSTWAVGSRWLFYTGVMLLAGVAAIGGLADEAGYRAIHRRLVWWAVGGSVTAGAGAVSLEEQQRGAAGLPLAHLVSNPIGHQLLFRGAPLLAAGVAAALLAGLRSGGGAMAARAGLAASAAAAMLGDVDASHAAGSHSWGWLEMFLQWLHFAAAGLWLGGLAVLVAVLGRLDTHERRRLGSRFSVVALAGVGIIVATATLRGVDEIGTWAGLFDTGFGRWALVKIGLLGGLVALGFHNRRRLARSTDALRRVGSMELGLAVVVLVATGFLQTLAPPTSTRTRSAVALVVTGSDFATTIKARLSISPGTVGFDRMTLHATDYDTGKPIIGAHVTLTFTLPTAPDLAPSTLDLTGQGDGDYTATAGNLARPGRWSVTSLVQRTGGSAQIPFAVTPRVPAVKVDQVTSPGLPTVYTIHSSPAAWLQVYLDPGRPGLNEFHITVLSPTGDEVSTSAAVVYATTAGGSAQSLDVRRLDDAGHFVADLPAAVSGRYRFDMSATTKGGSVNATITIPLR